MIPTREVYKIFLLFKHILNKIGCLNKTLYVIHNLTRINKMYDNY